MADGCRGGTFVGWLAVGAPLAFALGRMATVMVISCPHALGLAVPLVVAVSAEFTARSGALVRDRAAFERARGLQAVVFDKTGTLTEGAFSVANVVRLDGGLDETAVLRSAAGLERSSEHPIAATEGHIGVPRERDDAAFDAVAANSLAKPMRRLV